MAYSDRWEFRPKPVKYHEYADGTRLPDLDVEVYRNGVSYGYVNLHTHRTKYPPHASVGVTSRVGPEKEEE